MKTLYKVSFTNEKHEILSVHAKEVYNADILGFVELSELVFVDSSDIIINPEDDKIKSMFKDTRRVLFPISSIVRIDEITVSSKTPVITLYNNGSDNENN